MVFRFLDNFFSLFAFLFGLERYVICFYFCSCATGTLVSAILVIVADKSKPQYAMIAYIPTLLFLVLDTYYLGLEKGFRNSYNDFIRKLHKGKIESDDLFAVLPKGNMFGLFFKSLISFSVWPFYLTLIIMIYIAKCLVF